MIDSDVFFKILTLSTVINAYKLTNDGYNEGPSSHWQQLTWLNNVNYPYTYTPQIADLRANFKDAIPPVHNLNKSTSPNLFTDELLKSDNNTKKFVAAFTESMKLLFKLLHKNSISTNSSITQKANVLTQYSLPLNFDKYTQEPKGATDPTMALHEGNDPEPQDVIDYVKTLTDSTVVPSTNKTTTTPLLTNLNMSKPFKTAATSNATGASLTQYIPIPSIMIGKEPYIHPIYHPYTNDILIHSNYAHYIPYNSDKTYIIQLPESQVDTSPTTPLACALRIYASPYNNPVATAKPSLFETTAINSNQNLAKPIYFQEIGILPNIQTNIPNHFTTPQNIAIPSTPIIIHPATTNTAFQASPNLVLPKIESSLIKDQPIEESRLLSNILEPTTKKRTEQTKPVIHETKTQGKLASLEDDINFNLKYPQKEKEHLLKIINGLREELLRLKHYNNYYQLDEHEPNFSWNQNYIRKYNTNSVPPLFRHYPVPKQNKIKILPVYQKPTVYHPLIW